VVQHLEDAWNAGDSAGFAAPFSADATFIHIYGGQIDGRTAIEEAHRAIFGGVYKGSRNHYTVRGIRFLRSDAAIVLVEARLEVRADGQSRTISARPTLVAVKQDGGWVLQMFQNTQITEMPAAMKSSLESSSRPRIP
jgi:uncharacterized protein (TIGR02246 family)